MKRLVLTLVFAGLFFQNIVAQKKPQSPKSVLNQTVKKTAPNTAQNRTLKEISGEDWSKLSIALQSEDWEKSSGLAQQNLQKLTTENSKKQIARLRYIFLFSLAGKVSQGKISAGELEKTAQGFIGKEFLPVGRQFLEDCAGKVNYICPQKGSDTIFRVTATNKAGDSIHFFEYTKLSESFNLSENIEKIGFIGGFLSKAEISEYQNGVKILRLIFEKGYIKIATD